MIKLTVEKPGKYDICFSEGFSDLSESISNVIKPECSAFIITDTNVAPLYLEPVIQEISGCFKKLSSFIIKAGEQSKTLKSAEEILKKMIDEGFTRDDIVIALGGGVVGDLSGFCASVFMRGIGFIQIPTTLLSQIDSSIGGKVAVDMDSYKNMVGSFHNPCLVYENSSALKTLPAEQFLSGMGEVVKSALLGDEKLWDYLLCNLKSGDINSIEGGTLMHILYNTCIIKKKVVEEDPFDTGRRAVLNLGHTIGHAVEKCSGFMLTHGGCVALGTVCAAYMSMKRGYISENDYKEIYGYIKGLGLDVKIPDNINLNQKDILKAVSKDKKNGAGGLKFIFLEKKGNAVIKNDVNTDEITAALNIIGISR